jgi:hypothetical protein
MNTLRTLMNTMGLSLTVLGGVVTSARAAIATAAVAALLVCGGQDAARAGTWVVNNNSDCLGVGCVGTHGTLRWAIQQSNANPSPNNYNAVEPPKPRDDGDDDDDRMTGGRPPHGSARGQWVIALNSLLPLIIGPVTI